MPTNCRSPSFSEPEDVKTGSRPQNTQGVGISVSSDNTYHPRSHHNNMTVYDASSTVVYHIHGAVLDSARTQAATPAQVSPQAPRDNMPYDTLSQLPRHSLKPKRHSRRRPSPHPYKRNEEERGRSGTERLLVKEEATSPAPTPAPPQPSHSSRPDSIKRNRIRPRAQQHGSCDTPSQYPPERRSQWTRRALPHPYKQEGEERERRGTERVAVKEEATSSVPRASTPVPPQSSHSSSPDSTRPRPRRHRSYDTSSQSLRHPLEQRSRRTRRDSPHPYKREGRERERRGRERVVVKEEVTSPALCALTSVPAPTPVPPGPARLTPTPSPPPSSPPSPALAPAPVAESPSSSVKTEPSHPKHNGISGHPSPARARSGTPSNRDRLAVSIKVFTEGDREKKQGKSKKKISLKLEFFEGSSGKSKSNSIPPGGEGSEMEE